MPTTAATDSVTVRAEDRERLVARLARVEGQLRGVQRMIREGSACESVAQQLAAARGGLHGAFCDLIACAFQHRLAAGEATDDDRDHVSEIVQLLQNA